MALDLDATRLVEPLGADLPCGEDLDEAADLDFLNGLSHVEAQLPSAFFSRDDEGNQQVFDRSTIDFGRESKRLLGLLDRTRDLRLLTLLARLAMLDRDLRGFGQVLVAVAGLLETQWEAVHPRGEDGSYDLRAAVLHALDDVPTVVLPLQHVPLVQSRRHGPISFRTVMVADGEVPPRNGDPSPDRGAIERVLAEAEPEALKPIQEALATIAEAADRIGALTLARAGYGNAVVLERLSGLVGRIRAFLGAAAAPEAAPATASETGAASPDGSGAAPVHAASAVPVRPAGAIATTAQASAALAAAAAYLRAHEPSSPAEVLVRQAQMLVGKSFLDVMRILMPEQAAAAAIVIGANRGLRLTFDQLAAVPDEQADAAESWDAPAETPGSGDAEAAGAEAAPEPAFRAATRAEAVALLREVGSHFRRAEPASPIPLLLEKAAGFADRDFLAILKDVLPAGETE